METVLPLAIAVVAVGLGLWCLFDGQREENDWVEFNPHPFVGGTGAKARHCIVWSTDGREQCGGTPEDHVYNREDCRHEW